MGIKMEYFGVNIRVLSQFSTLSRIPIKEFSTLKSGFIKLNSSKPGAFLKCPFCGHNDFKEGGYIGFYECHACDEVVQVIFDNKRY